MSNNIDKQYTDLLQDILENGVKKEDRTGVGTLSVFGRTIRHKMSEGFPLLTTKKLYFRGIVTELLWFLRGDTNIKYLVDNDCHIWDGDAYRVYLEKIRFNSNPNWGKAIKNKNDEYYHPEPYTKEEFIERIKTDDDFAKEWGTLGKIYGNQWRKWGLKYEEIPKGEYYAGMKVPVGGIDQIANLINDLKENPDSRRLIVNAWNVGEINEMALPPCHYGFQCWTRELSLDERAKQHPKPEMFYDLHASNFSIGDSIENSNFPEEDRKWLHEQFDKANIPKRAISLQWNQRSVDTFLGLPFNIASYGLLLEIIAKEVNMVPDELIGVLGDTHLYLNHIEQAKEQIGALTYRDQEREFVDKYISYVPRFREPFELPTIDIHPGILDYDLDKLDRGMFTLHNYKYHPAIKAPLNNG